VCVSALCVGVVCTDFPPSLDDADVDSALASNPYSKYGYRFCQGNCSTVPRPLNEFLNPDSRKCSFCCDKKRRSRMRVGAKKFRKS
jgi:hypothetical protein